MFVRSACAEKFFLHKNFRAWENVRPRNYITRDHNFCFTLHELLHVQPLSLIIFSSYFFPTSPMVKKKKATKKVAKKRTAKKATKKRSASKKKKR